MTRIVPRHSPGFVLGADYSPPSSGTVVGVRPFERTGTTMTSQLVRPNHGRMIAGVCAGVAHRFGLSPFTVRALFLLSCLIPGPQFVFYLGAWILIPSER